MNASCLSNNNRRNGGRPSLPDVQLRRHRLQPAFTDIEIAQIEQSANAVGLSAVEYLRRITLGRHIIPVPAINREQYTELGKLAVNINQIARQLNSFINKDADHAILLEVLTVIHSEVQQLRRSMIGAAK